jgi:hypothetical protein
MKTNTLVNKLTAFRTWDEMEAAMQRGYCPTLNGGKLYGRLADLCRLAGYKVFRNGQVA